MPYLLNGTDLATFGITPGRASGSNISISGHLDFPSRMNVTGRSWGDENGMEPYVSTSEMQFGGRDIIFHGYLQGDTRAIVENKFMQLYEFLRALTDKVDFVTPHGTFSVYVKDAISPNYYKGFAAFNIVFRDPIPDLSGGTIPASGDASNVNGIDGIDFAALGFNVVDFSHMGIRYLTLKGILDRPSPKSQSAIGYFSEAYQITRTEAREYTLNAVILANDYAALVQTAKNLYALFKAEGVRVIYLPHDVIRLVYVHKGFTIKNIDKRGKTSALLEINFTEAQEAGEDSYLFLVDTVNNYVVTTVGQKIVVRL